MRRGNTKTTLMKYSKEELIEHIMCLEQNINSLECRFEIQYQNCMRIVDDMKLLNDTYLNRHRELLGKEEIR